MFDEIVSVANLYRAAHAAAKGKRKSAEVSFFNFRMEKEIEALHHSLVSGKYCHGGYGLFKIYDPKEREIAKAPFRDRVVHHAVHDVIEPLIDKKFIFDSYACRKDKGTHAALDRAQGFLKANRYCFHGDIRKYFPSIDHETLKGLVRRQIDDARVLTLLDGIIDSTKSERGLPIGNLTSQFFANLYLHELDFFVKHHLGCRYYIRYMDDVLVFENDRARLEDIRSLMGAFLRDRLKLDLHAGKSQIFDTRKGIKFLGFRLYADHRRLTTFGVRRFRNRLKRFRYLLGLGLMDEAKAAESVLCWRAHSDHADAARLRAKLAKETVGWSERVSGVLGVAKSNS
ncbi:MAG: reverse transcriptase/maturase family protein [Candidatus Omnitrophota bacterium]